MRDSVHDGSPFHRDLEKSMSKYLRKKQAADYLRISLRTLHEWMRNGVVPYRKVSRIVLFLPEELDEALSRFRFAAIGEWPPKSVRSDLDLQRFRRSRA